MSEHPQASRWREKGVPQSLIEWAKKYAESWVEGFLKYLPPADRERLKPHLLNEAYHLADKWIDKMGK